MRHPHPLAKVLKERHTSLRKISTELGISPSHLSLVLRGERRLGIDTALRLSKKLGIPLEEFFK